MESLHATNPASDTFLSYDSFAQQGMPIKAACRYSNLAVAATSSVCLLLNGTSALFRPLVPRIVEVEHTSHVKNDLK